MAEVGFLMGSGLAVWSEFFATSSSVPHLGHGAASETKQTNPFAIKKLNLLGFDIDTQNFKDNFFNLYKLGAF